MWQEKREIVSKSKEALLALHANKYTAGHKILNNPSDDTCSDLLCHCGLDYCVHVILTSS